MEDERQHTGSIFTVTGMLLFRFFLFLIVKTTVFIDRINNGNNQLIIIDTLNHTGYISVLIQSQIYIDQPTLRHGIPLTLDVLYVR